MVKMLDPVLFVRVKKDDSNFVRKFFPELEKEFGALMLKETGKEYNTRLELDNHSLDTEW